MPPARQETPDPTTRGVYDAYLAVAAEPARPGHHLHAAVADSRAAVTISASTDLPGDLWEPAVGISAAARLHDHALRTVAVLILYYIQEGLDTTDRPAVGRG